MSETTEKQERLSQTILALDTATSTGYAIYKRGEVVECGVVDLASHKRGESPKPHKALREFLTDTLRRHGNGLKIVKEGVYVPNNYDTKDGSQAYKSLNASVALKTYEGIVLEFCETNGLQEPTILSPNEWRRFLFPTFGKRNREQLKEQAKRVAKSQGYSVDFKHGDDKADALSILFAYLGKSIPATERSETKRYKGEEASLNEPKSVDELKRLRGQVLQNRPRRRPEYVEQLRKEAEAKAEKAKEAENRGLFKLLKEVQGDSAKVP